MNFTRKRIFLVAVAMCIGAAISLADRAESTPQDVFDGMRGSFQPAKAKGVHARYQWDLSGPTWWRMVDRGKRRDLQDGQGENRPIQMSLS